MRNSSNFGLTRSSNRVRPSSSQQGIDLARILGHGAWPYSALPAASSSYFFRVYCLSNSAAMFGL
jgi:hypothetical protein